MATITAGDFRNSVTFEYDNDVCQVIEFQHVKPGKGAAFVRTKYKRIMNGGIREESFNPTAKFETAYIERKEVQYLYDDGEAYNFMDQETFDQFAMPHEEVEDRMKFVKEEMTVKIMSYKGKIFDLEPPLFVELEVTETEPGFKGNTSTGATKPCTVETGAQINVPLFVRFFVCYPAKYIQQLCTAMQHADFAIKRLCLVQSRADKAPYLALAEGRKVKLI